MFTSKTAIRIREGTSGLILDLRLCDDPPPVSRSAVSPVTVTCWAVPDAAGAGTPGTALAAAKALSVWMRDALIRMS